VAFSDAVVINDAVNMAIVDLSLFGPAEQASILDIQTDLNAIVAAGPGGFDSGAVTTMLLSAADLVNNVLPSLDCDGFLAP
jgi:hypothetical protein